MLSGYQNLLSGSHKSIKTKTPFIRPMYLDLLLKKLHVTGRLNTSFTILKLVKVHECRIDEGVKEFEVRF